MRDDASRSDLLFQTSDTTWQAYNTYGGNSFYTGQPANRAFKLSYNRPLLGRGDPYHGFFANEYPMIRWIEANGFDTSYTTGVDSHRRGDLIRNHKLFLSVGHDEYWSSVQRANVEAARNAGVNLAFFSGNSVYWKTRWEPSIDGTSTPYRTLVSYKETWANAKIDPSPEWTGTWRDPRFSPPADGGRPENALQGTFWVVNCCNDQTMFSYTIKVPAEMGRMRLWRNTSLQSLSAGQVASLTPGILGFEWDTDADNGFRPPGLIRLSQATYDVTTMMLDFGSTVGPGRTTHYLTLYRHASGALVFGAGTTRWAWGLDEEHDGTGTPADPRMQQATVNLFADMGAQPFSLQPGLVGAAASTDGVAPTATFTSPAAGATMIVGDTVTVSGTASDSGGLVAGVEFSADGGATWRPADGRSAWTFQWKPSNTGTTSLLARAIDDSGNIQPVPTSVTVNVGPRPCPCTIFPTSSTPTNSAVGDPGSVEVGVKFSVTEPGYVTGVRFFKGVGNGGTHIGNLWSASGQLLARATFVNETASGWQQVNFSTPVPVAANTTYIVSYFAPTGRYAADAAYFQSGIDVSPIRVPSTSQAGGNGVYAYGDATRFPNQTFGAANYWVDVVFHDDSTAASTVTAVNDTFSTFVDSELVVSAPGVLGNDTVAAGGVLSAVKLTDAAHGALLLSPDGSFTYTPAPGYIGTDGFTYRVISASGIASTATVALNVTPIACPCSIFPAASTPAIASASDGGSVELGMKFTTNTAGIVRGVRFYKGPGNTGSHVGSLWNASGQLLARATFVSEFASGWQQVEFAAPVPVAANTTYVVSYFAPNGGYSYNGAYFGTARSFGPLRAPASAASGGNGVYRYGPVPSFPNQTYNDANYWVDVVFDLGSGASGGIVARNDSVTAFRDSVLNVPAPGVLANDTEANGAGMSATKLSDPVNGLLTLNADGSLSYSPNAGFVGTDAFTYRATSSSGQSATATVTFQVTEPTGLFAPSTGPAIGSVADFNPIELGVKFSSTVPGYVKGVRFYKGPGSTGAHIGNLWTVDGQLLATATFIAETAGGWQQVNFPTSVPIAANTLYVVSYYAPAGGYSATPNFFAATHVSGGILQAPAGGNGLYRYTGGGSAFPNNSFNATNYWVDLVFGTTP